MRSQVVFAILLLFLEAGILLLVSGDPLLVVYLGVLAGISILHSNLTKTYKPLFGTFISSLSLLLIFTVDNLMILPLWCVISLHIWYLDYCLSLHERSSEPVMETLIMLSGFVPCWYAVNKLPSTTFLQGVFLSLGSFTVLILCWLSVQADFNFNKKSAKWMMIKLMIILSFCLMISFTVGNIFYNKTVRGFFHNLQSIFVPEENDFDLERKLLGLKNKSKDFLLNTDSSQVGSDVNAFVQQINNQGKPRLRLPVYLRRSGYYKFTGSKWLFDKQGKDNWVYDIDDGKQDGWTVLDNLTTNLTTDYIVYLAQPGSSSLLCLPGTVAVGLPRIIKGSDNTYRMERPSRSMIAYTAHANILKFYDIETRNLEVGKADKKYLKIPEKKLMERLKSEAEEITSSAKNTREKILTLKDFMRSRFKYEQKLSKPKKNMLENFLYGERKGNCTLYATAFTLYLRALGIPSRVGTGYCSSTFDAQNNVYVFFNDDAHAWTEIFFKDYGWVIVDATPPADSVSKAARYHDFADIKDDFTYISGADSLAHSFNGLNRKTGEFRKGTGFYFYWLIFICALSGTIYLVIKSMSRLNKVKMTNPLKGSSEMELTFFSIFCNYFAVKGCRRRRGQTVKEYINKLKSLKFIDHEFDDLVNYYYAVKYENSAPSLDFEKSVVSKIRNFDKQD